MGQDDMIEEAIRRQFAYEDPAVVRRRLVARLEDLRPCACGQPATQLVCGPPVRIRCRSCFDRDLQELAKELADRDRTATTVAAQRPQED